MAERVAAFAAEHRDAYALVVTTQDWHIAPGAHFSDDPDFIDSWPPHGLAETAEAQLHPALADLLADVSIKKGQYDAGYSGFDGRDAAGRELGAVLDDAGVGAVDVVGIAESHCVRATALDSVRHGYDTRVLTDLTVPVTPELGAAARAEMQTAGVELLPSTEAVHA